MTKTRHPELTALAYAALEAIRREEAKNERNNNHVQPAPGAETSGTAGHEGQEEKAV